MFCKEYHDSRYFDALDFIKLQINWIYLKIRIFIYSTRIIGLNFIQRTKIKNLISDFAMGI